MAWGPIVAVVIACSLILAGLWAISRNIEAARERKRQRLHALHRRISSFLDLVESIPFTYLGSGLRQFALEQVQQSAQEILRLDPTDQRASKMLADVAGQLATPTSEAPPFRLSTQVEASNIRRSLIEAARFLQLQHQQGLLAAQETRQLLNAVKASATRVQIDAMLLKAVEARQQDKAPTALLLYQRALDEIRKHPTYPKKEETIARLLATLEELGKTSSAFDKPAAVAQGPSALTRALEADMAEEEQWKKKRF